MSKLKLTPKEVATKYAKEIISFNEQNNNFLNSVYYFIGHISGRLDYIDEIHYIKLIVKKYPDLMKNFCIERTNNLIKISLRKETIEWLEKMSLLV